MIATGQFQLLATQAAGIAARLESPSLAAQPGLQAPVAVASILDQVAPTFDAAASLKTRAASEMLEAYSRLRRIIEGKENPHAAPALLRGLAGSLQRIAKELEAVQAIKPEGPPAKPIPAEPTDGELRDILKERLCLNSKTWAAFSRLTLQGFRGLYVLLAVGAPPENVRKILKSGAVRAIGGADILFAQAAQLYDLGVEGFDSAFRRDPNYRLQVNYLAGMDYNIAGQLAEHREAARLAAGKEVEGVLCSVRMPVDWRLLPPAKQRYIRKYVLDLFQGPRADVIRRTYRDQHWVEVDLVARHSNGDMRLIEVKSTCKGALSMNSNRLGLLILQGFRHSLLFAQQRFDGVELYLDADDVDKQILAKLLEAAEVMEIPYSVSVGRGAARQQLMGRQAPLTRVSLKHIQPPQRPLPELI